MGHTTIEKAIDMIVTNDVFLHTWDLARATGLDETLDPIEVQRMYEAMEPMDEMLRSSGQFGPRVEVPDTADAQTKLIAFVGRDPRWFRAAILEHVEFGSQVAMRNSNAPQRRRVTPAS